MSLSSNNNQASAGQVDTARHCVFHCSDAWFAIPATVVREITYAPEISAVPGSHTLLAGMCHLRSEFVPVIRIDTILANGRPSDSEPRKLLVLDSNLGPWAILITEVAALESLDTLNGGEVSLDDSVNSVVLGTAMFGDQVVRVLDPNRLQQWSQRQLESEWQLDA